MRTHRLAALLLAFAQAPSLGAPPPDGLAAAAHVAKARALAGTDFAGSLFMCDPGGNAVISAMITKGRETWLPPTRAFDNLFYIGNDFVGVWVLRTSAGLILFDSGESIAEARDRIVPGLRQLGLDPATVRTVIVTHAHWDHYGGAKFFQDEYGAHVGLSAADWTLLERAPAAGMERAPMVGADRYDRPLPRRDLVIRDGQALTLGDATVRLYVTPGHTPGTVSAILPVREGGRTCLLSLLGGTAFPPVLEPSDRAGGLIAFQRSVERLAALGRAGGAVGIINTHIFVDGSAARLAAARARQPGEANPFLLGAGAVGRYYGLFDECLKAAAERPLPASAWSQPLPATAE